MEHNPGPSNQNKLSPRMRTYYSLIVAIIVVLFVGALVAVFFVLGLAKSQALGIFTVASILISATTGVLLVAIFIGRRILSPMVKLSNASKEVARGNFDITVTDRSRLDEVQTTFRNFNAMVRQLQNNATLASDFTTSVSHEFKTPLTAIEGYAMLLQDPHLPEETRQACLEKILYNTNRMTTLVGTILMLSKIEHKTLSDQCVTYRLDEQLRQAVVSLEREWTQKDIEFAAELTQVDFFGCQELLHHVWTNLLSNAIKFSPPGGLVRLELLEQTECVIVSVIDQGCGMTEEVCSRIFDKFYQADASHKSEGNGLGLALVKRIVELCRGLVEVRSAPGQGSTFRVILPKG